MFRSVGKIFALVALIILSQISGLRADMAIFAWVDDVPGECTTAGYVDWIECTGFGHGISLSTHQLAQHIPVALEKKVDRTSPVLNHKLCMNDWIPFVYIDFTDSSAPSNRYLRIELEDVFVDSVSQYNSAISSNAPIESVALNYRLVRWSLTRYDNQGNPTEVIETYGDPVGYRGGHPDDNEDGDYMPDIEDWDDDNDGISDRDEAIAGTNQTDPDSVFRLNIRSVGTNKVEISWNSVDGRIYTIGRSTNLVVSPFTPFIEGIAARSPQNVVTTFTSSASSAVFRGGVTLGP